MDFSIKELPLLNSVLCFPDQFGYRKTTTLKNVDITIEYPPPPIDNVRNTLFYYI